MKNSMCSPRNLTTEMKTHKRDNRDYALLYDKPSTLNLQMCDKKENEMCKKYKRITSYRRKIWSWWQSWSLLPLANDNEILFYFHFIWSIWRMNLLRQWPWVPNGDLQNTPEISWAHPYFKHGEVQLRDSILLPNSKNMPENFTGYCSKSTT